MQFVLKSYSGAVAHLTARRRPTAALLASARLSRDGVRRRRRKTAATATSSSSSLRSFGFRAPYEFPEFARAGGHMACRANLQRIGAAVAQEALQGYPLNTVRPEELRLGL